MVQAGIALGTCALSAVIVVAVVLFICNRRLHVKIQEARRELLERESTYENLFDSTSIFILLIDPSSSRIIHANKAAVDYYEYEADQLLNMRLQDLHPGLDDTGRFYIDQINSSGKNLFRVQHRKATGAIRDLEVSGGFTGSIDNNLLYLLLHDETDKVETEKQIETEKERAHNALKVKEEFLANISHELRTPLNGLVGMLNILETIDMNEEDKGFLSMAQESAQNLYEIIRDLIDFNDIQAGKLGLADEIFNIKEAVELTLSFFNDQIENKGLEVSSDMDIKLEGYRGDRTRFIQVLANLISNAVKYTDEGSVEISVRDGENLKVMVSDQGIGIAPDALDEIFTSFHQLENPYTKRFQGVGLGLSITKEIVSLMGGSIEVESVMGKGSVFTIILPDKFCEAEQCLKKTGTTETEEQVQKKTTVLIVEDEAINRLYLSTILKEKGYNVVEAVNGYQAIERCIESAPDMVLMDISLPKLSGLDAAMEIHAIDRYRDLPIVALTAHAHKDEIDSFISKGLKTVITKPVQEVELLRVINSITNGTI